MRPFKDSEDILSEVGFRLFDRDEFSVEEVLCKENMVSDQVMPAFKLDFDAEKIENDLCIPVDSVRLIISVEDRLLKKRILHTDMSASQAKSQRIDLSPDFCHQFSWVGPMRFTVALVLAENRKAPLGEASRAGNWLAKKEFVLSMTKDSSLFRIESVPPERFEQFGLLRDTAYFVHILTEDFNQSFEDLSGLFTIYMNESVSLMLSRTEESKHGQALARIVYSDIVATILGTCFSYLSLDEEVQVGGFLHTAIDRISKNTGIETRSIVAMGREPGNCRLRALLQSETGLTKALVSVTTKS